MVYLLPDIETMAAPWDVPFLPNFCTKCDGPWTDRDFGFSPRQQVVDLVCEAGHEVRFNLTLDQVSEFLSAAAPWMASKPVRLVGGSADGEVIPLPGPVPEGTIRTESGDEYAFRREDPEAFVFEVILERHPRKPRRPWTLPWKG